MFVDPAGPQSIQSPGELLTAAVTELDRTAVLSLSGELDLSSAAIAERACDEALATGMPVVVVDLTELRFLSSTGLQILVRLQQRAAELQASVALVGEHSAVTRPLQLTGMNALFPRFPTVGAAVAASSETRPR